MAINYLNSISLNKNELQQAVIENQPNDASAGASPVEGQLYFDTTNHILKQYNGTSWEEVGGGVETLTTTDGTYINLTPNSATSGAVTVTADLSASGTGSSSTFLRGDNTWATPVDTNSTYDLSTASTGTAITLSSNDASPDNVTISGTNNEIEVTRISGSELRVGLPDDVNVAGTLQVVNEIIQTSTGNENSFSSELSMNSNQIYNLADPTTAQSAATKAYVDAATVGGLVYQGGYNAATNTPDLDSSPSTSIKKGWTYTVTADGLFFTEQVRAGDVLVAEQDAPTTLANWTTVQNNIDLASLTQVGIGNVNASTNSDKTGLYVAYSGGTASIGFDVDSLDQELPSTNTDAYLAYYDDDATKNKKITFKQLAGEINLETSYAVTITDTATITHNLGSKDVVIQLYDVTTNETVYADVVRGSTTQATITFSATPTNSIRVLVQKIG